VLGPRNMIVFSSSASCYDFRMAKKEYGLKAHKLGIREQVQVGDPIKAFHLYVAPGLGERSWVEKSQPVTDTGMSMREWAGLVIHGLALSDLTGEPLLVGKDYRGGDGVIAKSSRLPNHYEGFYVESTLVTHKKYTDLTEGIEERIKEKSKKGENYAHKTQLIVWCNINGDFEVSAIESAVSNGNFQTVDIVGFNDTGRVYLSLILDKDDGLIHRYIISERYLLSLK
jgi:hypothetical protein